MQTIRFGNGDELPMIGLGTWKSQPGEVGAAVTTALRLGYRHIDCAFIYGNEAEIGAAIQQSGVPREELWITSKLWNNSHAERAVEPALRKTLADLRLDYLDLYLIHWPVVLKPDKVIPESADDLVPLSKVPIHETWRGMEHVLEKRLVRHIGVSNFSVAKLKVLLGHTAIPPAMNQVEMHPYFPQNELVDFCASRAIPMTAYSPFGSPDSAGGKQRPSMFEDEVVTRIAKRRSCTPAQVLLAFTLARGIAVIPKSVHEQRMAENLAAADVELDEQDRADLRSIDRGYRFIDGTFWVKEGGPYTLANLWDD